MSATRIVHTKDGPIRMGPVQLNTFPVDLRDLFKSVCARRGMTMVGVIEILMRQYVKEAGETPPPLSPEVLHRRGCRPRLLPDGEINPDSWEAIMLEAELRGEIRTPLDEEEFNDDKPATREDRPKKKTDIRYPMHGNKVCYPSRKTADDNLPDGEFTYHCQWCDKYHHSNKAWREERLKRGKSKVPEDTERKEP